MGMGKDDLPHLVPRFDDILVLRIHRIHPDSGQDNMMLPVNLQLDVPDQQIQLIGRIRIRNLYMNGTVPGIRTIVIEHQVIRSLHVRKAHHRVPDCFAQLHIIPLTQDLRNRILQHFNAGLDDDYGDNRTEPGFQRHMENKENAGRHQSRRRDDRIERGVFPRIDQGIRVHPFTDTLDIAPEHNLNHDSYRNNNQGDSIIIRRLRMNDLLH